VERSIAREGVKANRPTALRVTRSNVGEGKGLTLNVAAPKLLPAPQKTCSAMSWLRAGQRKSPAWIVHSTSRAVRVISPALASSVLTVRGAVTSPGPLVVANPEAGTHVSFVVPQMATSRTPSGSSTRANSVSVSRSAH
jgi:hypothetical protein